MKAKAIGRQWHLCVAGVMSAPDFSIIEGRTFKEALKGRVICTFPETTSRTVEKVYAEAKLIVAAPELLLALKRCVDTFADNDFTTAEEYAAQENAHAVINKVSNQS